MVFTYASTLPQTLSRGFQGSFAQKKAKIKLNKLRIAVKMNFYTRIHFISK